jgi:hypothetical protein
MGQRWNSVFVLFPWVETQGYKKSCLQHFFFTTLQNLCGRLFQLACELYFYRISTVFLPNITEIPTSLSPLLTQIIP